MFMVCCVCCGLLLFGFQFSGNLISEVVEHGLLTANAFGAGAA
jgi:hypothetical protein